MRPHLACHVQLHLICIQGGFIGDLYSQARVLEPSNKQHNCDSHKCRQFKVLMPQLRDLQECRPSLTSGSTGHSAHAHRANGPGHVYKIRNTQSFSLGSVFRVPWIEPPVLQGRHENEDLNHSNDRGKSSHSATAEYGSDKGPALTPQPVLIPSNPDTGRQAISRTDLDHCRQALRRTVRDCDSAEFRSVSCLISCLLSSARWLTRREILAATTLLYRDRVFKKPMNLNQRSQEEHWLHKCNHIVVETLKGHVIFRSTAMRTFLRSFSIQGIDTSHRTMALICRNQIELDRRFARDVTSQIDRSDIFRAVQIFSPYVSEFGSYHLKAASLTSMIVVGESDQTSLEAKHDGNEGKEDFEIIQRRTQQLSLGEEGDDWVVLNPTRV